MKTFTKIVLAFILSIMLASCVVNVSGNIGTNNKIEKATDDVFLTQRYETDVKMKKGIK